MFSYLFECLFVQFLTHLTSSVILRRTEEKKIRAYKANKINLKPICQLCKLACFNDSLHPNSWNNLKAFFPLSLRVINERSWLLIRFSWSVVKREDRRWAWSCSFSLNPNVKHCSPRIKRIVKPTILRHTHGHTCKHTGRRTVCPTYTPSHKD